MDNTSLDDLYTAESQAALVLDTNADEDSVDNLSNNKEIITMSSNKEINLPVLYVEFYEIIEPEIQAVKTAILNSKNLNLTAKCKTCGKTFKGSLHISSNFVTHLKVFIDIFSSQSV